MTSQSGRQRTPSRLWRVRKFKLRLLGVKWRNRMAAAIGAVTLGLVALGFADVADRAQGAFSTLLAHWPWAPLALTPLGFAVIVAATRRWAPFARGSGIPQVIAAARRRHTLQRGWRKLPGRWRRCWGCHKGHRIISHHSLTAPSSLRRLTCCPCSVSRTRNNCGIHSLRLLSRREETQLTPASFHPGRLPRRDVCPACIGAGAAVVLHLALALHRVVAALQHSAGEDLQHRPEQAAFTVAQRLSGAVRSH